MKLVINRCYGGFSLSSAATVRFGALKGLTVHVLTKANENFRDPRYRVATEAERTGNVWSITHSTALPDAEGRIPDEAYFGNRPEKRDDPHLVQTVEELGKAADGDCAELKIVEIPDGVSWELGEYDGIETVEEQHRSWR